jgi:hypothetical protein
MMNDNDDIGYRQSLYDDSIGLIRPYLNCTTCQLPAGENESRVRKGWISI